MLSFLLKSFDIISNDLLWNLNTSITHNKALSAFTLSHSQYLNDIEHVQVPFNFSSADSWGTNFGEVGPQG